MDKVFIEWIGSLTTQKTKQPVSKSFSGLAKNSPQQHSLETRVGLLRLVDIRIK